MTDANPSSNSLVDLFTQIATQVEQARQHVRQAVNTAMVESHWQIGRMIIEHEQHGNSRAEYGQQQLSQLSQQLTERLGKGFDVTNLRNMRRFYLAFPIRETVSLELSWSHTTSWHGLITHERVSGICRNRLVVAGVSAPLSDRSAPYTTNGYWQAKTG